MNSTLALKKSDYESELGEFMGWGRGEAAGDIAWSAQKTTTIRMDVASGLRRFYFNGHNWSFLKPFANLTLREGATTVLLPDDFGGVEGGCKVLVLDSDARGLVALDFRGIGDVVQALGDGPDTTGIPQMLAQRPVKVIPSGQMQTSELVVFPAADQEYTLKFPYYITPNYLLDVTQPYAYGGVEHHETILECILAVAEQRRDNSLTVHSIKAEELLRKSIDMDRRKNPTKLGYNGDRSDGYDWDALNGRGWTASGGVSINGTIYN